jgi:hypothetical protein
MIHILSVLKNQKKNKNNTQQIEIENKDNKICSRCRSREHYNLECMYK